MNARMKLLTLALLAMTATSAQACGNFTGPVIAWLMFLFYGVPSLIYGFLFGCVSGLSYRASLGSMLGVLAIILFVLVAGARDGIGFWSGMLIFGGIGSIGHAIATGLRRLAQRMAAQEDQPQTHVIPTLK